MAGNSTTQAPSEVFGVPKDINQTCNIYLTNKNSTLIWQRGWERIPETFMMNVFFFTCLVIAFVLLRREAWSRKSRELRRTHRGWLQFLYGDRDQPVEKTTQFNYESGRTGSHTHDNEVDDVVIVPPSANLQPVIEENADGEGGAVNGVSNAALSTRRRQQQQNEGHIRVQEETEENDEDLGQNKASSHWKNLKDRFKRLESVESVGLFSHWLLAVLYIKDDDIRRFKGKDSLQYLQFQRTIILFLSLVTAFSLIVILPVNLQGSLEGDAKPFGQTTLSNLAATSTLLWVHAIFAAVLHLVGLWMMYRFSRDVRADDDQITRRTLLIKRIPKAKTNKEDLSSFFEDLLHKAHGTVIDGIQFVYDVKDLNAKALDHRNTVNAQLYCEDYTNEYGTKNEVRPYFCGQFGFLCCHCCPKVDATEFYRKEEEVLSTDVQDEFKNVISTPSGGAFVTFKDERLAQEVYKTLKERQRHNCGFCSCCNMCISMCNIVRTCVLPQHDPYHSRQWTVSYAPYPDDINWSDLAFDYRLGWLWKILVYLLLTLIFLFLSTPAIALNALQYFNLSNLLEGGVAKISPYLTEFVSPLLLMLLAIIFPAIITYFSSWIPYETISALNHAIMWKVYFYLIMMVIVLPSTGLTSVSALLSKIFGDGEWRWECLFPVDNGAFFVNYVINVAFIGNAMELMRLHELIMYMLCFMLVRTPAEYENARQKILFDFSFGVRYPRFLLIFAMVVTYCLSCPLIAPAGLLYMVIKHLVDRYNIRYVYSPSKINGRIHSTALVFVHIALLMMQFQIFTFNFLRVGYETVTGFSLIILVIGFLIFSGHCFLHWFGNINYLTYSASNRSSCETTRKVKRKEYCACAYLPPILYHLNTQGMAPRDFVSAGRVSYGAVARTDTAESLNI